MRMVGRNQQKSTPIKRKSVWKGKPRATITQTTANNKLALLKSALDKSGFWKHIEQVRRSARVSSDRFRVLIKPDLELFNAGDATGTDPEVVEHLIDLLYDRGYTQVAIGDARNVWDLWLENRGVCVLAELVGYHYVTPQGRAYDVLDLSEDVVSVPFPAESVLHGTGLGRAWVEAHYRINFAKNKTHEEFGFALCLQNLLGVLPLRDKEYHYRHRLNPWDVCVEVHRQTPAHFNIIDAFVSNHGSEGPRANHPIKTRTLILGANALLADWTASLKMGLDPYASPINAKGLREIGLPSGYEIVGNLTPYPGWINAPPLLIDSIRKRNRSPTLSRLLKPWLQSVNRELFPFKDLVNDRVNDVATKYLSNLDLNNAGFYTLVGLNYLLAFMQHGLEAYQIGYNKQQLRWKDAPLDFDPAGYASTDYRAVADYMKPLARIIRQTPPEPNGLRWRYLDGSVLFEYSHLTPVPFEQFVARVDIAAAVRSMNDYIGGACVPITRNGAGRVIYQAERNIYLPQPNWISFFGGEFIDVGKLEYIEYKKRSQKIFWRTIRSSNGSAEFDDGIVTFAAIGDQTRVTVIARQKFTLPLFWQFVNIDLAPKLKDFLIVDAYTRYFRQTIANLEAQYQGREFRIGRSWNHTEGEAGSSSDQLLEGIIEMLTRVGTALGNNFGDLSALLRTLGLNSQPIDAAAYSVDEEGFRHFAGQSSQSASARSGFNLANVFKNTRMEAATFFVDLAEAMRKDIGPSVVPSHEKGHSIS
jgi:uncharacterized protein (DUF362 family)